MRPSSVQGNLYVISGPSGVGKDTLVARLFDAMPDLKSSVSVTSRSARTGEVDGVHYYFLSLDKVKEMINNDELIEWNEYADNIYGTPRKFVDEALERGENILFSVDVNGALNIKRHFKDANLIFVMPPSLKELKRRLINRGTESENQIASRLEIAQSEIDSSDKFDICIINDNLDDAVNETIDFINQSSKIPHSE